MKNVINIMLMLTMIGGLVFTACQQEDKLLPESLPVAGTQDQQQNPVRKSSHPDEVLYDETLEALAKGLSGLASSGDYRTLIYGMAEETFDGEHNVLIKLLSDSIGSTGGSLLGDLKQAFTSDSASFYSSRLKKAIAGFDYYQEKAFAQIYLPFIQHHLPESFPTIVIDYGNNEVVVPGLKVAANGNISQVLVDEEYARQHLVWVVSMNESIDTDEALAQALQNKPAKESKLPEDKNWSTNITYAAFDRIKIVDKKEPWISGRAEISYAGMKFGAPNNVETYCEYGANMFKIPMAKIANKQLGKWTNVFGYLVDPRNNGPMRVDEGFFILIWEKDKRKRNEKSVGHLPEQCSHRFYYVSNEPPYGYSSLLPLLPTVPGSMPNYTNPVFNAAMPTTTLSRNGYDYWTLSYGSNDFTIKYSNK